jgi:hypothetical protein
MSTTPAVQLKEYVQILLESHNCAVENDGEQLNVVLSSEVADALNTNEPSIAQNSETPYRIFYFNQKRDDREGTHIEYGGELLKSFSKLIGDKGLTTARAYENAYLKKANLDMQMHQTFQWIKIKPVWQGAHERLHSYLLLYFKYKAVSDDRREGVASLVISEQTGALSDEFIENSDYALSHSIQASVKYENMCSAQLPAADVFHNAYIQAQNIARKELYEFTQSMERRRERDIARINEYYATLKQQIEAYKANRSLSAEALKKQELKLSAVERDREHKQKDITEKYTIDITITPFAAIRMFVPVLANSVILLHGKAQSSTELVWNSITKQFDPMVCAQCKKTMYTIWTCDNWHLVCGACRNSVCKGCGKKQCFLCEPVCGRCGK